MLNLRCERRNGLAALAGISLIEVLISLVILSIGLLGTATLQALAKRANFDALQRTTASQLAFELLERMRANPGALDDYIVQVGGASQAVPADNCTLVECTPAQMVSYDLWSWESSLDGAGETNGQGNTGGLSQPAACITGPAGGVSGTYQVTIAWRGMTPYADAVPGVCGAGLYGENDEYRRLMTLSTFIQAD